MTDDSAHPSPRLGIDWVTTVAGALAALSSAVLLSTLGAAGTLLGAALGSVIATVGSALYAHALAASRRKLTTAQAAAREKVRIAQAEVLRANRVDDTPAQEGHLEHAEEQLAQAQEELDALSRQRGSTTWKARLAALPWKHIGLAAAAIFVVTVLVITAFELLAGRSVSSFTGGSGKEERTTIGNVRDRDSGRDEEKDPEDDGSGSPTPSESTEPTEEPTEESTEESTDVSTPTETETPEPTPTEVTTPTGTPSPTLSEAPAS